MNAQCASTLLISPPITSPSWSFAPLPWGRPHHTPPALPVRVRVCCRFDHHPLVPLDPHRGSVWTPPGGHSPHHSTPRVCIYKVYATTYVLRWYRCFGPRAGGRARAERARGPRVCVAKTPRAGARVKARRHRSTPQEPPAGSCGDTRAGWARNVARWCGARMRAAPRGVGDNGRRRPRRERRQGGGMHAGVGARSSLPPSRARRALGMRRGGVRGRSSHPRTGSCHLTGCPG